jgi:hypothetical protein
MTTDVEETEQNVHAHFFQELGSASAALHAFKPDLVVRSERSVHLLANSNAGFEDFPRSQLYPLTWNPTKLFDSLRAIPGLTEAGYLTMGIVDTPST